MLCCFILAGSPACRWVHLCAPLPAADRCCLLLLSPTLPLCAHSRQRHGDFQNSMEGWGEFLEDMRQYYGVDLDCLSGVQRRGRAGSERVWSCHRRASFMRCAAPCLLACWLAQHCHLHPLSSCHLRRLPSCSSSASPLLFPTTRGVALRCR